MVALEQWRRNATGAHLAAFILILILFLHSSSSPAALALLSSRSLPI
jgi:hypothetical protein